MQPVFDGPEAIDGRFPKEVLV